MNKVAMIGCGGTGSYLLPILLRMLQKDEITLFDGDAYTKENLDRQLFPPEMVGMNKAKALASTYKRKTLLARPSFLKKADELEGFDFVFACPDNHIARARVLQAADKFEMPAVLCGNEFNSASAMIYLPEWKGTKLDPRIRYPELLTDKSGSPTEASCTGEVLEDSPQLALANNASAVAAMELMYFWVMYMTDELSEDKEARPHFPVEFNWCPSKCSTVKVGDLEEAEPEKEKKKDDKSTVKKA
jgi:molybdopterin/thiamine biosynthesis adenylyltransferase